MGKFIKTFRTLARVVGISTVTLGKYQKLPGWPGKTSKGYDIQAVNKHIANVAQNQSGSSAGQSEFVFAKVDEDMGSLKKWQVFEHARKAKLANDLKEGKLMPRVDHEEIMSRMLAECQSVLGTLPGRLAPEVVGLTAAEAEELIQAGINEALKRLHDGA